MGVRRHAPLTPLENVACYIHQITDHRTAGGQSSSATPDQHLLTYSIPTQRHGIIDPIDIGQPAIAGDQSRMHPYIELPVVHFRQRQQLDAIPQLTGIGNIEPGEAGNPLGVDVLIGYPGAKSQRGEQGQLLRRINTLDVKRRIGFGVTQFLRCFEDVSEVEALIAHVAEDVIRRAVDDARNREELIRHQAFFDAANDRNAAPHAGFKTNITLQGAGGMKDLLPMLRQQGFIGGHHMLPLVQGGQEVRACRFVAADQLDHDSNVRVADDLKGVLGQLCGWQLHRPRSLWM